MVDPDRPQLLDVVFQVLDAHLAHADAHDETAAGQLVDARRLGRLDGGVAHVGRGDAEPDGYSFRRHAHRGQGGETAAGLQPVLAEPVVGLGNPEPAHQVGFLGLARIRLHGRQWLVGFEDDPGFGGYSYAHYCLSPGIITLGNSYNPEFPCVL